MYIAKMAEGLPFSLSDECDDGQNGAFHYYYSVLFKELINVKNY